MKKIILFLTSLFVIISCSTPRWYSVGENMTYKETNVVNYSEIQFDSICNNDTIPNVLSKWIILPAVDYESGEKVAKYMYIKGNSNKVYYLLTKKNDEYLMSKRYHKIIKEEKK